MAPLVTVQVAENKTPMFYIERHKTNLYQYNHRFDRRKGECLCRHRHGDVTAVRQAILSTCSTLMTLVLLQNIPLTTKASSVSLSMNDIKLKYISPMKFSKYGISRNC